MVVHAGASESGVRHGEYKVPGVKLVVADLDVAGGHLADVRVSGDFFLEPDEVLPGNTVTYSP